MGEKIKDELFEQAAKLVVLHQQGSTSLIVRKLNLGFNRASRIIDQLEESGIIGTFSSAKPREVFFKNELELEQHLNNLSS